MIKFLVAGVLYLFAFGMLDDAGFEWYKELGIGLLFVIGAIISQGGKK